MQSVSLRTRRRPLILPRIVAAAVVATAMVLASAGAVAARDDGRDAAATTIFKGRLLCADRGALVPLRGASVELWKLGEEVHVLWFSAGSTFGYQEDQGWTDSDGSFSLQAPRDEKSYVITIRLSGDRVVLRNWWESSPWSVTTESNRSDVSVQD